VIIIAGHLKVAAAQRQAFVERMRTLWRRRDAFPAVSIWRSRRIPSMRHVSTIWNCGVPRPISKHGERFASRRKSTSGSKAIPFGSTTSATRALRSERRLGQHKKGSKLNSLSKNGVCANMGTPHLTLDGLMDRDRDRSSRRLLRAPERRYRLFGSTGECREGFNRQDRHCDRRRDFARRLWGT